MPPQKPTLTNYQIECIETIRSLNEQIKTLLTGADGVSKEQLDKCIKANETCLELYLQQFNL